MWRAVLRVLGVVFGVAALVVAFFASVFRFDSEDEYRSVLRLDVVIGIVAAASVLLVCVPSTGNTVRPRFGWFLAALFAGLLVSGGLARNHYDQYLIRSGR